MVAFAGSDPVTFRTLTTMMIALAAACAETGQDQATVQLSLAGTESSGPIEATGNVFVTIERADLAFGPLYLCAGTTAGDLCDTARLEWLDTAVVDTLDPTATHVGELIGVPGTVRSWMYDLAISSQLTRSEPYVLKAAEDLGNASFVIKGQAQFGGIALPFFAAVAIAQSDDTELGVPVIRKSASAKFYHEVAGQVQELVIRFDPSAWVRGIDFRPFFGNESCAAGGGQIACNGTIETICDDSGNEIASRDCSELEQVCVPGQGCADTLIIESDSEAFRSLRNALAVSGRPRFEWDD